MNKKILMVIFMLLCTFTVIAEDKSVEVTKFEKCSSLNINVDTSFSSGKYYLEGCDEIKTNNWHCNCSDGYVLYIKMLDDTLDDYQFSITHNYLEFSYKDGNVVTEENTESLSLANPYRTNHCNSLCGDGVCMNTKYCFETNKSCALDCAPQNETIKLNESNTTPVQQQVDEPTPVFLLLIVFTLILLFVVILGGLIIAYIMGKKKDEFEDLKANLKYDDLQKFINDK